MPSSYRLVTQEQNISIIIAIISQSASLGAEAVRGGGPPTSESMGSLCPGGCRGPGGRRWQLPRGMGKGRWRTGGTPGTPLCDAVHHQDGSPPSLLTLCRATAMQNNLCLERVCSHRPPRTLDAMQGLHLQGASRLKRTDGSSRVSLRAAQQLPGHHFPGEGAMEHPKPTPPAARYPHSAVPAAA